ncbi:DUF2752 domain-containing protein [Actinomadura rugatobispora]|uniref:DUF2752 domain-containing protein n=1 Tax=Actinomadura rugatobispora TaxID=1994 RepID=A0ABW1A7J6_9ACTN|nr:hypothetical protein GCM10010200_075390 [Actinomadura rugatobispora]
MTGSTPVQGPPAGRTQRRGGALLRPLGVGAAAAVGAVLVAFVDPHEPGHYPTCPSLGLTGWYCPGCGGLRMTHSLMHGDVGQAFGMNPLVMLLLPVFAYLWIRWTVSAARGVPMRSVLLRPRVLYAFLGVLGLYWILRNLPFAQVLAP